MQTETIGSKPVSNLPFVKKQFTNSLLLVLKNVCSFLEINARIDSFRQAFNAVIH